MYSKTEGVNAFAFNERRAVCFQDTVRACE